MSNKIDTFNLVLMQTKNMVSSTEGKKNIFLLVSFATLYMTSCQKTRFERYSIAIPMESKECPFFFPLFPP